MLLFGACSTTLLQYVLQHADLLEIYQPLPNFRHFLDVPYTLHIALSKMSSSLLSIGVSSTSVSKELALMMFSQEVMCWWQSMWRGWISKFFALSCCTISRVIYFDPWVFRLWIFNISQNLVTCLSKTLPSTCLWCKKIVTCSPWYSNKPAGHK